MTSKPHSDAKRNADLAARKKAAGKIKVSSSIWVDLDQAERMRAIYRKAKQRFEDSGK